MNTRDPSWLSRLMLLVPAAILLLGIVLRLYAYIDNRCLWTDEVDVALNVFERNYAALAQPLDYGQYAPPVFLWILKGATGIFGFGEMAYRLYPLLCGIAALLLFYNILKRELRLESFWYPLLLLATGLVYIRYSTEVKQYMPDAFITLLLVWLALRTDIIKSRTLPFIATWIVAGSIAIWSSMPSVFVLAGVGCYYTATVVHQRRYNLFVPIVIVSVAWLAQFLWYYFSILNKQIHSDFLVNFHNRFFLFALPSSSEEWTHNKEVITEVLRAAFGANMAVVFSTCMLLTGLAVLLIKKKATTWLYTLPVVLMLVAAALKQYSLIPRLTLFAMPLLLLLVGIGFDQLMKLRAPLLRIPVLLIALAAIITNNPLQSISQPIRQEQLTEALDYLKSQNIEEDELYVYIGAQNAYRYYTSIHPGKERYATLANATLLPPAIESDSIFQQMPEKVALLYTIPFDNYAVKVRFEEHLQLIDSYDYMQCKAYIFEQTASDIHNE